MTLSAAFGDTPDLSIRTRPPSPKRLSRKVLLAGALAAAGVTAWALIGGLSEQQGRKASEPQVAAATAGPPDAIQKASSDYDPAALQAPRDRLWGDHKPAMRETDELLPPANAGWANPPPAQSAPKAAAQAPAPPDPQAIARTAPILFSERRDGRALGQGGEVKTGAGGQRGAFLASQREASDDQLPTVLNPPRSRYEVLAGAVISASLLTELNSDLPGRVIAQVTTPVYDSVTGVHLLIPQGARLLGTYDSATTHGDNRILLAWNRIVFPNGWSINLQGMEAADPSGAAGLRDRTDNHLGPLAGAVGLSAIISVIARNSEDDRRGRSFGQTVGDAAAQEAARTGGRIVDRHLQVRPTLRVRVGAPVRVLVTRDIQLRPYRGHTDR
ncbi:MAG: TrbI/VirB10 family protein [Hyphomonadaceae bacterium]